MPVVPFVFVPILFENGSAAPLGYAGFALAIAVGPLSEFPSRKLCQVTQDNGY